MRARESSTLDYEGEITLIVGKPVRRTAQANWLDRVAGFSVYNEGSVREYQRHASPFAPGRHCAATGGFGPWPTTPGDIEIATRLNGQATQMAFGFADFVAYCTMFTTLVPGDAMVTGTPGGVGAARNPPVFMDQGDVAEIHIDPVGALRNPVAAG